jgi:hypothetical protein
MIIDFIFLLAVLKVTVDFVTMLIGAEGAKILENAIAFSSCGDYSKMIIQRPAGVRGWGDPTGA